MFIDNKYYKWYNMIITNAKHRQLHGYKEQHHIIPKCMGGSNKKENLVMLTAREHFICHQLLARFVSNTFYKKKMLNAIGKFVQNNDLQKRILSSRHYKIARESIAEANRGRIYTKDARQKMSNLAKGRIPWNKGMKGLVNFPDTAKDKLRELYLGKSFKERYGDEKANQIKKKISKTKEGKPSGMSGKTHTIETRKKMSNNMKGKRGPQKRISLCPCCKQQNVTARHIKFCN